MAAAYSAPKKLLLGLVVAFVALFAGFLLCEGVLRIAGYGHSPELFRTTSDAQGHHWWRDNRWVAAPYFPPELIRRPQSLRLPNPKPSGTYRVFILGSSAVMGDPEPAFSLSRMLELLLHTAYPSVHFEVVNAGITAINSHVVRSLARDCADLQPNLFIVYEGNNEVMGPYGPGTVFNSYLTSAFALRLGLAIRTTRVGQLASALVESFGAGRASTRPWSGMEMFVKNEIDRDDSRLATTRNLFRENLLDIVASGTRAGASVFVCTVLTNQKDFAPFVSRHRPGLSENDKNQWLQFFEKGKRSFESGDDAGAEAKLRKALQIDDHYAELSFRLGRLCAQQNRIPEAKAFFQQALDLDVLRFRTDSRLNQTIRELARDHLPNLTVVDLEAAANQKSPQSMLGDEFLYEHVHLNFQGTYEMARELFTPVSADLLRRKKILAARGLDELLSSAEMRRRLAYTTYEQAMIIRELQARFARPPFTAQPDNAERQRIYGQRATAAMGMLTRPETRENLASLYEEALSLNRDDWLLERNIGLAFIGLGLPRRAQPHLERVSAIVPDDPDLLFALANAQRQVGDTKAAEKSFAALRALDPRYPGLVGPGR